MYYPLIECVANVSEGRRSEILTVLVQAIESVAGVQLLHQDAGAGANRTVFTFAGPPEAVWESAFQLFKSASTLIDMQQHTGTHPRMGVVDVCPFVPVRDCTLEDCVLLARRLGERVWTELNIPVYLYEAAATAPYRRNLAAVRKGEYEGLFEKMQLPEWQVDFGTVHWNPRSGTTIIGARPFLIAWNINLSTADQNIARELATRLRESGRYVKDENGNKTRLPGLFSGLKAIGWYIEEYGRCQVSTNVVDPERVNLLEVYQVCCQLAKDLGTHVTGSELIGLIPAKYLLVAANGELTGPAAYDQAVINLGLADLEPFEWKERVLEEVLKEN